jgi:hypothetical protein
VVVGALGLISIFAYSEEANFKRIDSEPEALEPEHQVAGAKLGLEERDMRKIFLRVGERHE